MDILKKLNSLDVKDLKNINYTGLLAELRKRPDLIVGVLAVVGALVFCVKYYTASAVRLAGVRTEIAEFEKKNKILAQYQEVKKQYDAFLQAIPGRMSETEFMNAVMAAANNRRLKIESISPTENLRHALYGTMSVSINFVSDDYRNIWLFLLDMETARKSLRLDTIKINIGSGAATRGRAASRTANKKPAAEIISPELNVDVKATVVMLKNEQG